MPASTKTWHTYRFELDGVFAHADGRRWLPNDVTKRFIAARTKAGLAHFRLHDLRHFMATQMLVAGSRSPRWRSG